MSISNLFIDNDYGLNCGDLNVKGRLKAKITEIEQFVIDNIEVNNAIVNTAITTPHINSGTTTFNTVGTVNLGSVNGNIVNLQSTTAEIETINSNGSVNTPLLNTMQINAQNINGLNIVSNSVNSATGNIGTFTSQSATVDELTVTGNMFVDHIVADSLAITDPITVAGLSTPNISTNVISTLDTGNVTFAHPIIGSTLSLTSDITTPVTRTNTITTTTGSGNITVSRPTYLTHAYVSTDFSSPLGTINNISVSNMTSVNDSIIFDKPLSLPNVGTNESHLSYYEYATGSVNTSGCIVTPLNYRAVRVGNMVTISIQGTPASLTASSSTTINVSLPSQFAPFSTDVYGLCITMNAASVTNLGRYQLSSSGTLTIYQSLSAANFVSGDRAGFGSQSTYLTLSFTRAP